jgi:hypothetical protein
MNRRISGLNRMMKIGLLFLSVASASRWFLHSSAALSEQMADAMMGFLYGIAISCLLLGIWCRGRGRSTPCG